MAKGDTIQIKVIIIKKGAYREKEAKKNALNFRKLFQSYRNN